MHVPLLRPVRSASLLVGVFIILASLARWGGTAHPGPRFVVGVMVFTSLVLSFMALIAWLYRDMSAPATRPRPAILHRTMSALSLSSCAMFAIGFYWDEIWHRRFGGFGNDFLWPPHMLIYSSMLLFALFAVGGIMFTLRGHGSIRERLRSEPYIGLLGLVSAFLVISAPSDLLWHEIYGRDITAWSLPHITLAGGVVFLSLVAARLALSLHRGSNWRGLGAMTLVEWVALCLIVIANTVLLQFGTTEWEGIKSLRPANDVFRQAFWQRPMWLYPVVVISISSFISIFTLHAFKRFGTATLVALGVILFRISCLAILGAETKQLSIGYTSHLLMLLPALTLDAWHYFYREKGRAFLLVGGCTAATIAFSIFGFPIIRQLLIYPPITSHTIPPMVAMSFVMAPVMGWFSMQLSAWLGNLDTRPEGPADYRSAFYITAGLTATFVVAAGIMLFSSSPQ